MIPGPDPGACPECGQWRKAGMPHECQRENLTRCCDCGQPFSSPVTNWDDYFIQVEDAAFACAACGERGGHPVDA